MTNVRDLALMSNEALWSYFREQQAGLVTAAKSLAVTTLQVGDNVTWNHKCRRGYGFVTRTVQGDPGGATFLDRLDVAFVTRHPWSADGWGDWRDFDRPHFADDLKRFEYIDGRIEVVEK